MLMPPHCQASITMFGAAGGTLNASRYLAVVGGLLGIPSSAVSLLAVNSTLDGSSAAGGYYQFTISFLVTIHGDLVSCTGTAQRAA